MPDDATLTIAVKVRDEATRQLAGITSRVRKTVFSPLTTMATQFRTLFKRIFSLEGVLAGGALFATKRLIVDLAKNAHEFQSVFSPDTQSRLDAAGTAFNKLGASLKTTFGNLVAEFKLDEKLNAVSDWLQDNQQTIIKGFIKIRDAISDAFGKAKEFFESLAKGGSGKTYAQGGAVDSAEIQRRLALADQRQRDLDLVGKPLATFEWIDPKPEQFGPPLPGTSDEERRIIEDYLTVGGKHSLDLKKFATDSRPAADGIRSIGESASKAAPLVVDLTEAMNVSTEAAGMDAAAYKRWQQTMLENTAIIQGYLTVGEAATAITSGITDAFFDAINGTKSFGRAFADMTVSILNDISRLLVFRALFSVITGAIGGGIGGSTSPTGGAAGLPDAGGSLSAGFNGQSFAMGTSSARGGIATVGERGPERVILPRGARVEPSHRSGGGGGITINVVGARDPQATAAEVIAQMRTNPAFRRAFA